MKKILVAILAISVAASAGAAVLSPDEALARANASQGDASPMSVNNMRLVYTRTVDAQPAFYVFARLTGGYSILSADDCAVPVLGYCDNGSFDDNTLPPAMSEWLDEYAAQISWAREAGLSPSGNVALKTEYAPIAPLVKTQWNQSAPFNNDCPLVNTNRCVTGCVATALAQVVNYHKCPATHGTGTKEYTWSSQTLSFDYANATFDWANMLDRYESGAYNDTQAAAVANLMYACGVGVEMNYGTGASGAATSNVATFLIDNMGYRKDIHVERREYYTIAGWAELIYNQLKNFGPVQFSGRSNDGGHSFICDGYRTGGFYHFNWGWGGMSDGYFSLQALDPGAQGIGGSSSGYNFTQYIIANVAPDNGENNVYYAIRCRDGLSITAESASLGSSITVSGGFYNSSSAPFTGQMGFCLTDPDGSKQYVTAISPTDLRINYGYSTMRFYIPNALAEGTYNVSPVFKTSYGDWQGMLLDQNKPTYLTMRVEGTTAYFTTGSTPTISVTDLDPQSKFFLDTEFRINAKVTNTGSGEYSGYVLGALFDSEYNQIATSGMYPVYLEAGQSLDMPYISTFTALSDKTLTAGNYYFCFADSRSNVVSELLPIEIAAKPTDAEFTLSNFRFLGDSKKANRHDLRFAADVKCTSGYFVGSFDLYIFPYIPGQSVKSEAHVASPVIFAESGATVPVEFTCDFANGTLGSTYFTGVYYNGTRLSGTQALFTLDSTDAVYNIAADTAAELIATEVFNLSGSRVASSTKNLAPGHYIIRETLSDGTVKSHQTIVTK